MKNIVSLYKNAFCAVLLVAGCLGCTHHHGLSDDEAQLDKLAGSWKIVSVTNDAVSLDGYGAFALTLLKASGNSGAYSYSVSGRPASSPWPASGTWSFGSSISSQIIRNKGAADEIAIQYQLDNDNLEMDFDYNGAGYNARTMAVTGRWVFKFKRQ